MKIIALTPEAFHTAEPDTINRLFRAGLDYLHVRKPAATAEEVRSFIKGIDSAFYRQIIIHRYAHLKEEMRLGGFHVPLEIFNSLVMGNFNGILSASAHRMEECQLGHKQDAHLFISPVFNSISKQGYRATPSLLECGTLSRSGQLIALGGISANNILAVQQKGFDGAACLGFLWNSENPVNQFRRLQKVLSNGDGN